MSSQQTDICSRVRSRLRKRWPHIHFPECNADVKWKYLIKMPQDHLTMRNFSTINKSTWCLRSKVVHSLFSRISSAMHSCKMYIRHLFRNRGLQRYLRVIAARPGARALIKRCVCIFIYRDSVRLIYFKINSNIHP